MDRANNIQVAVEIGNISTMADGGNKVSLYTPELPPHEQTLLFSFKKDKVAFMVLAREDIKEQDLQIPTDIPEISTDGGKSPSQRLRGALYRLWEGQGKPAASFEVFYASHMEKLIDQVKAKL